MKPPGSIITGLIQKISSDKSLYFKTGWESLQSRRRRRKLFFFYKIKKKEQNTMVPNFYWKPDDLSVSYF